MKNFRILLTGLMVVLISISSYAATSPIADKALIEDIKKAANSFQAAVEQHNFKLAKDQLDLLFPLMKKEMKAAKKEIHEFEKNDEAERAEELEKLLERKGEINDKISGIVGISSAALRVKADQVSGLVTEYIELLTENERLVASE